MATGLAKRCLTLSKEFQRILDDRSEPDKNTIDFLEYRLDLLYQHSTYLPGHEHDDQISKIISNIKKKFLALFVNKQEMRKHHTKHIRNTVVILDDQR